MSQPPRASPLIEALKAAAIALAAFGGAGWLGWQIGWPATFDPGDVDFVNPISIMILGLLGGAVWFAVKAVRYAIRERRFGSAALDLDPPGHLRLGGGFSGRLKVKKPIVATGPFRIELTCYDTHEFEENGRWKTVHLPERRQVVASNIPPVDRFWKLVVTAPTRGPDFRAEVVVPTERRQGQGRLP